MNWDEILYGGTPQTNPEGGLGVQDYSAITQQQEIVPSPPASQEELQQRATGWQRMIDRVQTDRNLQRALLFAGSSMLAPPQWGESAMGKIAQGALTGVNAYAMGEEQQRVAAKEQAGERRAEEAHQLNTAGARQRLEAGALDLRQKQATIDDAIRKISIETQKAQIDLDNALDEKEVRAITKKNEIRKQQVLSSIPDALMRQSIEDELKAKGVELQVKREHAKYYSAAAGAAVANAEESREKAKWYREGGPGRGRGGLTEKQIADMELNEQTAPLIVDYWNRTAEEYGMPVETLVTIRGKAAEYSKAVALSKGRKVSGPIGTGTGAPAGPEGPAPKIITTDEVRSKLRDKSGVVKRAE